MQQIGTIYTIGYAHPGAAADVARLMQQEHIILLDVRLSPRSRWKPTWNRAALQTTYGPRYQWNRRLGNLQYQQLELGIELAEGHLDAAHDTAALLYKGTSLILMCVCKDARTCYRTIARRTPGSIRQYHCSTADLPISHLYYCVPRARKEAIWQINAAYQPVSLKIPTS